MKFTQPAKVKRSIQTCTWLPAAMLFGLSAQAADDYIGTVISGDGNTFRVRTETRDVKITLCGVESPERGAPRFLAQPR